jgi:hypothetical protein
LINWDRLFHGFHRSRLVDSASSHELYHAQGTDLGIYRAIFLDATFFQAGVQIAFPSLRDPQALTFIIRRVIRLPSPTDLFSQQVSSYLLLRTSTVSQNIASFSHHVVSPVDSPLD